LEHIYNTERPHQALGYLTPHDFLERRRFQPKKAECQSSCGRALTEYEKQLDILSNEEVKAVPVLVTTVGPSFRSVCIW
jgi:hypothetical protein